MTLPFSNNLPKITEPTIAAIFANSLATKTLPLPFYASKVKAGFPSPADDYMEMHLDLNSHLIAHPAATFFLKVSGDSMIGAGIYPNDMLVVDRSIEPCHGKIVIAVLNGEFTVKRLYKKDGVIKLLAENPMFAPIVINGEEDLTIWGVVIHTIRSSF